MRKRRQRKVFFWIIAIIAFIFSGVQLAAIAVSVGPSSKDVIINEFVAANTSGLQDEDGDYSDWIEIYNPNDHAINLAGWTLTDDRSRPEKWTFPAMSLEGRAYLVVFASGKDRQATGPDSPLHTNFRLNREGEFLGLYNVHQDKFLETASFAFARQFDDMAYGRYAASNYGYLADPTPGRANEVTTVWPDVVAPVQFSVERGFYDAPFTVALTGTTPGATIRYTLNGSDPDETTGSIYTGPISVAGTTLLRVAAFHPDYLPAPSQTQTYLFLEDILRQPADPPGFPPTWGQHAIDFAGYQAGEPVAADYEVDPRLVNEPRYRNEVKEALLALPSLSLVTDVQSFHLYANPRKRGVAWERPASIELIDPAGHQEGFQINAGVRIQGGAGRWEFMPKHSFRLFFKNIYGAGRLNYPLFPDSPVEEFNTLVLRAGVDRSYAGHPEASDHALTTYTRDEWLRASQIELSGVGSHGLFVHLYLNGLYWGLYNLVERPDAAFAASYLGGDEDEWYVANHRGTVSGSGERFKALLALAREDDLADPQKYALVEKYLDVGHFIDYMILNWYAGTKDWPENNWYAAVHNPAGRLKYFVWDGEESWIQGAEVHLGRDDLAGVPNTIKILFEALIKNPDFKLALADRLNRHLFAAGPLTDAQAQARWRRVNRPLEQAILGESMRWGDARYEPPITPEDWRAAKEDVLAQMAGNAARLIALARRAGYYPEIDPPQFNRPGGLAPVAFSLTMTAPEGDIYYTLNGSDPRTPATGAPAPEAIRYQAPLILTQTTRLKARALQETAPSGPLWSASSEATFTVQVQPHALHITEVMYNPPAGSDYEFIELTNRGETAIDLAGATFEQGIRFTFPFDTPPLAPAQTIVLAANAAAFAKKYPDVLPAGVYEGRLSNKGERVTLASLSGETLASIAYDDENGWPLSPDGRGDSLIRLDLASDPHQPPAWRASFQLDGSPGVFEEIPN